MSSATSIRPPVVNAGNPTQPRQQRAALAVAMLGFAVVTESRARVVRAGYEERRRLERDLHDGAQQRLETHVRSVLGKLGLAISGDDHRRVLAVLTYLRASAV